MSLDNNNTNKLNSHQLPCCPDVNSKYNFLKQIGSGTYGDVYKACDKLKPDEFVAVKKMKPGLGMSEEVFAVNVKREVDILKRLDHRNVVKLIDVCRSEHSTEPSTEPDEHQSTGGESYLVFELCHADLVGILQNPELQITAANIKSMLKQLFEGLFYLRIRRILHRDLKPANLLLTQKGVLKLTDFGLSKRISRRQPTVMATEVVTRWYRSPELLLGDDRYGFEVDMWSAGCIMAEMWTKAPILQGKHNHHQLELISELCGAINTTTWPSVDKLSFYEKFQPGLPQENKPRLGLVLGGLLDDLDAFDLLERLLTLVPSKRIDAKKTLKHKYFWRGVEAGGLEDMLMRASSGKQGDDVNFAMLVRQKKRQLENEQEEQQRKIRTRHEPVV